MPEKRNRPGGRSQAASEAFNGATQILPDAADNARAHDLPAAVLAAAELKPSEGLAADVRRQLVGMLSAQGTGASHPTVGKVRAELEQVERFTTSPAPERIDPITGEVESLDDYRGRGLADAEGVTP